MSSRGGLIEIALAGLPRLVAWDQGWLPSGRLVRPEREELIRGPRRIEPARECG